MMGPLARLHSSIQRTAPLLPVATGLVFGVVLDARLEPPWALWVPLLLATAWAAWNRPENILGLAALSFAAMALGGLLHYQAIRHTPADHIEQYVIDEPRLARVTGVVASVPRLLPPPESPFARWSYGRERTVFLLDVHRIEGARGDVPVQGRVHVFVAEAVLDLTIGESVEAFGWLRAFSRPSNPGQIDWSAFHRRQGVSGGISCSHRENVKQLEQGEPRRLPRMERVRGYLRDLLTGDLPGAGEQETTLLEAMVLGQRSRTDRVVNDVFIRAGCVHFLAVSGVHVGIVAFLALAACRLIGIGPRTAAAVMLMAVIAYALLTEPRPSVMRATVIALAYGVARLIGRERAYLNWLSAAVIILVTIDAPTVFDVGFQLSTLAVMGVVYLAPALATCVRLSALWLESHALRRPFAAMDRQLVEYAILRRGGWVARTRRMLRWAKCYAAAALSVACAAWLATAPVVSWHFDRVQPWGAISSLAAMPIVTILMGLSFVKLAASAVAPAAGMALAPAVLTTESALLDVVNRFAVLPGASLRVPELSVWVVASFYLFLVLLTWRILAAPDTSVPHRVRKRSPPGPPVPPARVVVFSFLLVIATAIAWLSPRGPSGRLRMTVLAVGAGTSTVLELPNGEAWLYDAGGGGPRDVGRNVIVPYLRHREIERIDRVYVSHPNLDHFNGLLSVVDEISAEPILINSYFPFRSAARSPARFLLGELAKREADVREVTASRITSEHGGVTVEYLWPVGEVDETLEINDSSTVLRICFAARCILLSGDIGERAQNHLLARGDLRADVLMLPHHGDVVGTTRDFIDAVGAAILIRSSDERMVDTRNGLAELAAGRRLLNTADVGAITVDMHAAGIEVRTMLGP